MNPPGSINSGKAMQCSLCPVINTQSADLLASLKLGHVNGVVDFIVKFLHKGLRQNPTHSLKQFGTAVKCGGG